MISNLRDDENSKYHQREKTYRDKTVYSHLADKGKYEIKGKTGINEIKGKAGINEIIYEVGYSDVQAFREMFKRITGVTPNEYRNKYNKAMTR